MNLEEFKAYCLEKPEATWDFPFDQETLVFRFRRKIFALTHTSDPVLSVNLKCDPFLARQLRADHPEILPGYHMNKEHWNTVTLAGSVTQEKFLWLVDHSYDLVRGTFKS